MATLLTIGDAAKESGLSAKMIRHYEQSGLLRESPRTDAGYRLYNSEQRTSYVLFVRHATWGFRYTISSRCWHYGKTHSVKAGW